jgi:predicted GNAT family N-acyltransferase
VFRVVAGWDDLIKVFVVRGIVFIGEQNTPYAEEIDDVELDAVHILGEKDGEPFASGRIRFIGEYAKLERIAVRPEQRGHGYAHQLVEFMLEIARKHGFRKFKMHAQVYLDGFYRQHGFEVQGGIFQEAGIDHYLMVKEG